MTPSLRELLAEATTPCPSDLADTMRRLAEVERQAVEERERDRGTIRALLDKLAEKDELLLEVLKAKEPVDTLRLKIRKHLNLDGV